MPASTITRSLRLAAQTAMTALSVVCLPMLLYGEVAFVSQEQAGSATPEAAKTEAASGEARAPKATPDYDSEIRRLRDIAYGKNEEGRFKEGSVRVREAARDALKQVVRQQIVAEEEAKAKAASTPAASASNPVMPTAYRQTAPAGANQAGQPERAGTKTAQRSSAAAQQDNWLFPDLFDGNSVNRMANYQVGVGLPLQPNLPSFAQPNLPGTGGSGTELPPRESSYRPGGFSPVTPVSLGGGAGSQVDLGKSAAPPQEIASALKSSDAVQELKTQTRSAVSLDPHIRGYRWGQIYAAVDGAYWSPARLDMDTMISKIDPSMVESVTVLSGPYGVALGPGLAFLDINRRPTPRYEETGETHFDTLVNVRSNGGQVYGRETVSTGGPDWGFRGSYGDRVGSDYRSGDGTLMPTSYHSRDAWGELGYDLDQHRRVNFMYQRLDQTDTECPGQFFNISGLTSYGLQAAVVDTDPTAPWSSLRVVGWYNNTGFTGNDEGKIGPGNPLPVVGVVNELLAQQLSDPAAGVQSAFTMGGAFNTGARAGVTFGDTGETQLNTGADFRYQGQFITEDFSVIGPTVGFNEAIHTNLPHAYMTNPGVYAEVKQPVTCDWLLSVGARLDYVRTSAQVGDLRGYQASGGTAYSGSLPGVNTDFSGAGVLEQEDTLYAFYVTNELKLGENWLLSGGFGHGQRPPTLVERYADGVFLSVLQSGMTRVIGNPSLRPERDWQIDAKLSSNYENWRSHIRGYYAWVQDYITMYDDNIGQPIEYRYARLLWFRNTKLASLAGFELMEEYDWNEHVTPYAALSYTEGRDVTLDAVLPGISPLEGVVGMRIHDANHGKTWGVDVNVRLVADQNRLGALQEGALVKPVEDPTAGFTVCNVRGYWNYTKNLTFLGGVDNLFNSNYQEHLDIRFKSVKVNPGDPETLYRVLQPGISPYAGIVWTF